MIAIEVTTVRAASIAMVLAASALICRPAAAPVRETAAADDSKAFGCGGPREVVEVDYQWQGMCPERNLVWPAMPISLELPTRAMLHGALWDDPLRLHAARMCTFDWYR